MALVYADRVQQTSVTTGTGTYNLDASIPADSQSFVAGIGNGNTCYYTAVMAGGGWEVGIGTVTDAATDTLARTTIIASSNAGAAVNWGAGTKTLFVTIPGIQAGHPPGTVIANASATLPYGYLLCDGAAISRTTYAQLFTALSTTWGAGDGSTTFNVPDLRGRVVVGAGTGTVTETQAAANFNVSDIITVDSNPMGTKPKWLTGMPVVVTTSGVLPTGIVAATTYWVRRLSATTISLYTSLVLAMDRNVLTGIVDITATGSGNHTLTCTMSVRALAETFGVELTADVPSHYFPRGNFESNTGTDSARTPGATDASSVADRYGDTNGVTNMPPSAVLHYIIKY